jgi:predicted RNase H-like HicB family nuclease
VSLFRIHREMFRSALCGASRNSRAEVEVIMRYYIGLLHKDAGSDYGVSFPDFPGCVTAGETLDEAHALAAEALSFHIDGMLVDGAAPPMPTPLERIMADATNRDGAAIVVPVRDVGSDAVRFDMSVDENTLSKIDDYAGKHG